MKQTIQNVINFAEKVKDLKERKVFWAYKMRKHKVDYDYAENEYISYSIKLQNLEENNSMKTTIQNVMDFAEKAKELKEKKEYWADRMQKHKVDYDYAEKQYFAFSSELAKAYENLNKLNIEN